MPQTFAKLIKYSGGRDVWGGHGIFWAKYTGPGSYVNSGTYSTSGEIIDSIGALSEIGAANTPQRNIDAIPPVVTLSGTYMIIFSPTAVPVVGVSGATGAPKRWVAHWFTMSGMTEVANTTSLTAQSAIVMIIGG